jgi:hypothetical protein
MKRTLDIALMASLGALCLSTTACDSKGTKEVKQEAKALDESYKAQADLVEATGRYAPDNAASAAKADAIREKGKAIKDHLIDEAKEVQRHTKS